MCFGIFNLAIINIISLSKLIFYSFTHKDQQRTRCQRVLLLTFLDRIVPRPYACFNATFNATHQVKAIAIAIVETNPLVEIVSVFLFSSVHTYGTYATANYIKKGMHPYLDSLYCNQFSLQYQVPIKINVTFQLNRPQQWHCKANIQPLKCQIGSIY